MQPHALPLAITIALGVASSHAQSPLRQTRNLSTPPVDSRWGIAAGDLDGDGDLDLAVGQFSTLALLRNDGRGRFVDATAGNIVQGANQTNDVALADIDGDGDLDLLVVNEDLQNRVYVNNGTGSFTDVTATSLPPLSDFSLGHAVADFDGDGDLDWFVSNGGPDRLYQNDGSGVFTDVSASSLPAGVSTGYHAFAVDIDADGDLDLFTSSGPLPSVLLNNGAGVFSAPAQPAPPSGFRCYAADIDADGLPDLLTEEGTRYHRNLGGNTYAAPVTLPFATRGAVDLDGDGDLDLLAAGAVLRNDGGGSFATLVTPELSFGYLARFAAADFDGDGDRDVIFGTPSGTEFLSNLTSQLETPAPAVRSQPWTLLCQVSPDASVQAPTLFGLAFASQGAALPTPFGVLRLAPSQAFLLAPVPVTGSATPLTWPIPNQAALVGAELNLQALVVGPHRPPFLSNAILDVIQ
jgi:hypothetical protein